MKPQTDKRNGGTWRVFCAIEIPEEVREEVAAHISELKRAVPQTQASWSRPENVHLTLKFFGEIAQMKVEQLSTAASRVVSSSNRFRINVAQTGVFPTRGIPRVLWIGINDPESNLQQLQARLEVECAEEGFEKEARPYHPHLTIARLRKPRGARTLAEAHQELEFKPAEVLVSELLVIRSELERNGACYTTISRHALVEA